ncbi:MAG: hypothetical protein HY077_14520 [Elusimicrobia bacterium]|nr:hypothetical protein [Elusimicrobiota bacterium]
MGALLAMVLLLQGAVAAEVSLNCVTKSGKAYKEPATLSALVACQQKKLNASAAAYRKRNRADPPESILEGWDDRQRAEVVDFVRRHPERAGLDSPKETAKQTKEHLPSKDAADTEALGRSLQNMSDGGKKGVTPEMAKQIDDYLKEKQGSVSPDMRALLDSTQNGPNLSDQTVSKLKDAAQAAKGKGLDLDVDKKTEDFLLAPKEPSPNNN